MKWLLLVLVACNGPDSDGETDSHTDVVDDCEVDVDEDGFCADDPADPLYDCDDSNPDIHPGAEEECNGIDDDCEGGIDEDLRDVDDDGICDELDTEECDCVDNDGDGFVDEDFPDTDGDRIADCCDEEECDGVDNDGDGLSDEGFDDDSDGIGACLDCDDGDAEVYPGADETGGDLRDEDCDGLVDEVDWVHGDLVITELMTHPAWDSGDRGEWFELLNVSGREVVLDGLVLRDGSVDRHEITALRLQPWDLLVLAEDSHLGTDGDVQADYVYGLYDLAFGDTLDQLTIEVEDDVLGTVLVDEVKWNTSFPDQFGASKMLDPDYWNAVDNDDGDNWCNAWESWIGEMGTDDGTPGVENPDCP